jgi:hypothetical protein
VEVHTAPTSASAEPDPPSLGPYPNLPEPSGSGGGSPIQSGGGGKVASTKAALSNIISSLAGRGNSTRRNSSSQREVSIRRSGDLGTSGEGGGDGGTPEEGGEKGCEGVDKERLLLVPTPVATFLLHVAMSVRAGLMRGETLDVPNLQVMSIWGANCRASHLAFRSTIYRVPDVCSPRTRLRSSEWVS